MTVLPCGPPQEAQKFGENHGVSFTESQDFWIFTSSIDSIFDFYMGIFYYETLEMNVGPLNLKKSRRPPRYNWIDGIWILSDDVDVESSGSQTLRRHCHSSVTTQPDDHKYTVDAWPTYPLVATLLSSSAPLKFLRYRNKECDPEWSCSRKSTPEWCWLRFVNTDW